VEREDHTVKIVGIAGSLFSYLMLAGRRSNAAARQSQ
jgi:hypothetical protein